LPDCFIPSRDQFLRGVYGGHLRVFSSARFLCIIHEKELVIDDVYIYNRVGSLIFHSPNNTEPWDGKYNGEHCPQGTYVYVIYYHKEGQKERNVKTGTVLLLY
jgi:gliding motility-associated-like protein